MATLDDTRCLSLPDKLSDVPLSDPDELLGIINPDIRMPMDMMEIILRLVDGSRVEQFKPDFGKGMITAWAHIQGKTQRHKAKSWLTQS